MDSRSNHVGDADHRPALTPAGKRGGGAAESIPSWRRSLSASAMAAALLFSGPVVAGMAADSPAWAVEPGTSQATGNANIGGSTGDDSHGDGSDQNGSSTGDSSGSDSGGEGDGGGDGSGAGSAGVSPSPRPSPGKPAETIYKIYLHWGPAQGGPAGSVDVRAGGTAQAIEGKAVAGYRFRGWFYDPACSKPFDWGEPVHTDLSAWACYEKEAPTYSLDDLSSVKVVVNGVEKTIGYGSTTEIGAGDIVSLTGVPSGWKTSTTRGADGAEQITVSSPDGKVAATWSFKRKQAKKADSTSKGVAREDEHDKGRDDSTYADSKIAREHDAALDKADGKHPVSAKTAILAAIVVAGLVVITSAVVLLKKLDGHEDDSVHDASDDQSHDLDAGVGSHDLAYPRSPDSRTANNGRQLAAVPAATIVQCPATSTRPVNGDGYNGLASLVRKTTELHVTQPGGADAMVEHTGVDSIVEQGGSSALVDSTVNDGGGSVLTSLAADPSSTAASLSTEEATPASDRAETVVLAGRGASSRSAAEREPGPDETTVFDPFADDAVEQD